MARVARNLREATAKVCCYAGMGDLSKLATLNIDLEMVNYTELQGTRYSMLETAILC